MFAGSSGGSEGAGIGEAGREVSPSREAGWSSSLVHGSSAHQSDVA